MIEVILCLLSILVMEVVLFFENRFLFWTITIGMCLVMLIPIVGGIKNKNELKRIARTKILYVFRESTGSAGESTAGKTTFMLYYRDGTKRARTVPNGTKLYNSYMSLTEGD